MLGGPSGINVVFVGYQAKHARAVPSAYTARRAVMVELEA